MVAGKVKRGRRRKEKKRMSVLGFALDDDRLHDVLFVTLFGTVTVSEFE